MKTASLILGISLIATALHAQQTLPAIEVKTLDGQAVNIQAYGQNEKITVLSFWATWCAPCKKELDAYARLYADWQAKYAVEVLAITIDNQRALPRVAPMVASREWPFEVLSDAGQRLQRALDFQTIPQTFVLDREGRIAYAHSGFVPGDEYELEEKIRELAGKE
jgi:peroxiredoxin